MLEQESQTKEVAESTVKKTSKRYITPTTNVYESDEETRIVLDMPGVDEKSVDISYDKDVLTVEGKNSYSVPEGFEGIFLGFKTGDYLRRFNVHKPIALEKSKAVMKNGRLTVHLSKVKPNITKIEVKTE